MPTTLFAVSDAVAALIAAGIAALVSLVTALVTFQANKSRLRAELRTEYAAEEAIRSLLNHPTWTQRSFKEISRRLRGFEVTSFVSCSFVPVQCRSTGPTTRSYGDCGTGTRTNSPDQRRPRTVYGPDYCGGFLLDPDGNSAEAVHTERSSVARVGDGPLRTPASGPEAGPARGPLR